MSFIKSPTAFKTARVPHLFEDKEDVFFWKGRNADAGLLAFQGGDFENFIITENLYAYNLKIDGRTATPQFSDVNGYIYWKDGDKYFYYSTVYGWVYCDAFPGYEPIEERIRNDATNEYEWVGDAFYSGNFPSMSGVSRLDPRGLNKSDDASENEANALPIEIVFPRWWCNDEFGEYDARGGATGKKIIGIPKWRGNNGKDYLRSAEKNGMDWRYGDIRRKDNKWLIGTVGSATGWWEGTEPQPNQSVTFQFMKNNGSDAQGENITLGWVGWVKGEERETGHIGEVAICY